MKGFHFARQNPTYHSKSTLNSDKVRKNHNMVPVTMCSINFKISQKLFLLKTLKYIIKGTI